MSVDMAETRLREAEEMVFALTLAATDPIQAADLVPFEVVRDALRDAGYRENGRVDGEESWFNERLWRSLYLSVAYHRESVLTVAEVLSFNLSLSCGSQARVVTLARWVVEAERRRRGVVGP